MLYKAVQKLKTEVANMVKEKVSRIEPIVTIFERGLEAFRRSIEEEAIRKYELIKPVMNLVNILKAVTNNTLDEDWALSTLVLAALENIVNIKLKELAESTSGDFRTSVSRLKEALVKEESWNEREASDLTRRLRGKYEERYVIIHGGYENPPSREAALEDLEFLRDVLRKLFGISRDV